MPDDAVSTRDETRTALLEVIDRLSDAQALALLAMLRGLLEHAARAGQSEAAADEAHER